MRFQKRDGEILKAIYLNDGVLARRHIKELFWPDKSWRAMEKRLSILCASGYIVWPSRKLHGIHPIPEPICWLGWKGVDYIAGELGISVQPLKSQRENQLRELQKRLRRNGIRWVREPRWSLLRHDLAIVDFRMAIERSIHQLPLFTLENWIVESEFRADMDTVIFSTQEKDGNAKNIKRGVCPDAYFEIVDQERRLRDQPAKARFLLELDMATHDNPSFGREKAKAGVAYIKSYAYKERFGNNSGRWLIVTKGRETRIKNLMKQTKTSVGLDVNLFFFTSLDELGNCNILVHPIWRQIGRSNLTSLLQS